MPPPPGPTPSPMPSASLLPPPGPPPSFQYRDPNRYIGNQALPTNLAGMGVYAGIVLLSDLMLLYRLLVKCRYRFIWVVGPTLLTIGSFVISIIVVTKYAHVDQTVSYETLQKDLDNINPWVPPAYAIAFLANLSITALMMAKTSFGAPKLKDSLPAFATRRRHTRGTSLSAGDDYVFDIDERTGPVPDAPMPAKRRTMSSRSALFAGIIESGALAPIFMLVALILYVAQDAQETLLVPMLAPLAALIPTLQIIQLQLGLDSEARNRPISRSWSESERSTGPGGSPYLVPAPRYHDSSSEEDISDGEARLVNGAQARKEKSRRSHSSSNNDPVSPTTAKRFSARNIWAWRSSESGSGSRPRSHTHSNSLSSGRSDPPVMLQMRDLTGSAERAGESEAKARNGDAEDDIWERIKLDDSKPHIPEPKPVPVPVPAPPMKRRSTLRKNSISKDMISKPVPIAADFPPTTANLPSTTIVPALPNFTINTETGVSLNGNTGDKYVKIKWTPGTATEEISYGPTEFVKEWASLKETGFSQVDAILPIPGHDHRAYFFSGDKYARIEYVPGAPGDKILGGVRSIADNWASLKKAGFDRVDSALPVPGKPNEAYFFSGIKYIRISYTEGAGGDQLLVGPTYITTGWSKTGFNQFDTTIPRPGNDGNAYIFSGDKYSQVRVNPSGTEEIIVDQHDVATSWKTLHKAGFY
ncbi:unnamed protein product [Rhizoctonia solani]|uniref:Uncharacterized protein n=1 Tax=Rhizoctonia solani TaxID=456999 RepID=A0A8H3GMX4_9AGAM|nr:unnamed protein product [Rhizoctonia solani]